MEVTKMLQKFTYPIMPKWIETVDHNDPRIKMVDELMTMDYSELVMIAESENIEYTYGMGKYELARMIAHC